MLCLEDCLALCDLSEEEVLAIAQHEHIPEIAAAELGNYLVHTPEGEMRIKAIIRDDIAEARVRGDRAHELALKLMLRNSPSSIRVARNVTGARFDRDQRAARAGA